MTTTTHADSLLPARLVGHVGVAIGLCILGDSLMYSILPLQAESLGIALPLVGVLLSANRLIRLLSNSWASALYERMGPRLPFLAALMVGVASTAVYGMASGFLAFLLARIVWGMAWSALRQGGYVAVWSGASGAKGRLTGLLWGLVRLGSAISVLLGGVIFDRYGYSAAIGAIVLLSVCSIPVALLIRWPVVPAEAPLPSGRASAGVVATRSQYEIWRGWLDVLDVPARRWLAAAGFLSLLLSSVVLATTSLFLAERLDDSSFLVLGIGVGAMTGVLHGARWLTDGVLGPAIGFLSDRFGQAGTAVVLAAMMMAVLTGAVFLPIGPALVCLLLMFVCDAGMNVVLSAAASGAATDSVRPHIYVGAYTTLTDAGSAIGPLLAFTVGEAIGLPVMYLSVVTCLALVLLRYWRATQSPGVHAAQHPFS